MDPRPAATMIVSRPARGGVEVLVERRAMASRFAPGFVVFPGGVVEPGDAGLATRLFGDAAEAPRACGIRELFEETALLVTGSGLKAAPGASIEDAELDPPAAASLPEIARWIAPESLEVRFDAAFYALEAPRGVDPTPDGVEIAEAWWARPADVVEASIDGEAPLMWPTLVTLEALEGAASVEEVLSTRIPQEDPPRPGEQPRRGRWRRPEGGR